MHHAVIPMYRRCHLACRFCAVSAELDGHAVPVPALRDAIVAARDAGHPGVTFTGGEPLLSPQIVKAIAFSHGIGLRTAVSTNGRRLSDPQVVGRLVATGLDAVHVALHAVDPAIHRHLVGGEAIAHEQSLAGLRAAVPHFRTTLRTVLTTANDGELEALVALAAELGADFELRLVQEVGATTPDLVPTTEAALAAWRRAFRACTDHGVAWTWWGFRGLTPAEVAPALSPAPLDDAARALVQHGLPDAALLGGIQVDDAEVTALTGAPPREGRRLLAARRTPAPPAPRVAWEAPQGPIDVVVLDDTPPLAALSSLPGLAHALQASGRLGRLHTPWRQVFRPAALTLDTPGAIGRLLSARDPRPLHPGAGDPAPATAALLRDLQLAPTAVVWGARAAARVRSAASTPVRLVVIDAGDDAPVALAPGDVFVTAAPSTTRSLRLAGLPAASVLWSLPPVWAPHGGTRAPGETILVAGGAAVDQALVAATARTGPLLAWPGTSVPGATALRDDPVACLEALRTAALLWLPVGPGAGVDPLLIAWASALGVPRVVTPRPRATDALPFGAGRVAEALPAAQARALAAAARPLEPSSAATAEAWVARLLGGAEAWATVAHGPDAAW